MKTVRHFFSVLCVGLGKGWEFKSAENFFERMGGRITRTHFSNDMHDVAYQVLRMGCAQDAVFLLHRPLPEFAATVGSGHGFVIQEGMNASEAIVLAALERNPCVKCILFMDGADKLSPAFESRLGENKARLYCTSHTEVDWAKHFKDSGLFADFIRHFGGIPDTVGAA